jgi:protein-disulfide isomerase
MKQMKNFSIILSLIAVVFATYAIMEVKNQKGGIEAEQVAQILNDNPKMVVDAFSNYQEQQRLEAEKAAQEAMKKFLPELNSTENALSVGPEDAKVTVVEFFDFNCGYCKRLAPELEKAVDANSDVKFIFKPMTFLGSVYQAKGAYAAAEQGKFLDYYKAVMGANGRMSEADVDAIAEKIGLNMEKFKADIADEKITQKLRNIAILADNIQVHGVPAVFINGNQVQAMSAEELQNSINSAK